MYERLHALCLYLLPSQHKSILTFYYPFQQQHLVYNYRNKESEYMHIYVYIYTCTSLWIIGLLEAGDFAYTWLSFQF